MEKKTAEPKSDIIVEGSVGERIYVLASGKVQILQSNRMIHTLRNGYSRCVVLEHFQGFMSIGSDWMSLFENFLKH